MKKEINELNGKVKLLEDENAKNAMMNSDYRELIIGNEKKMKQYTEETKTHQKKADFLHDKM